MTTDPPAPDRGPGLSHLSRVGPSVARTLADPDGGDLRITIVAYTGDAIAVPRRIGEALLSEDPSGWRPIRREW